jgi:hypothetical protein
MLAALFPAHVEKRALWIAAAFAIGVTGAGGRAVIGSTMNEWPSAMLLVVALTTIVGSLASRGSVSIASLALSAIAAGLATGLKLTYGVFAVGLVVAIAAQGPWKERARNVVLGGMFLFAGFLVTYGFWGATLRDHFGNPFFPYFNHIFHSPWWEDTAWFDRNYGPRDVMQALFFPVAFFDNYRLAGEVPFVDWRLAAVEALAIALLARYAFARLRPLSPPEGMDSRPWIFLAVFMLASYVVWLKLYGIYRYLVPLELISGPLIVGGVLWIVRPAIARSIAVVALAALVVFTTKPADWGRLPFRGAYFDVAFPDIAPRALVILGSGEPMAYAIPFTRSDARFVSPDNNLLTPLQHNLLSREIANLIASHPGPMYSLDFHGSENAVRVLDYFGLARIPSTCLTVRSYLDTSAMEVCRVERVQRPK